MDLEDKAERAARLKKEKEQAAAQKKKEAEEKKNAKKALKEQAAAAKKSAAEEKRNKKLYEKQQKANQASSSSSDGGFYNPNNKKGGNKQKGGNGLIITMSIFATLFSLFSGTVSFIILSNKYYEVGTNGADGKKGDQGLTGLSDYEIFLKYHPNYAGNEEFFVNDVTNHLINNDILLNVDLDGGYVVIDGNEIRDSFTHKIKYREKLVIDVPKKANFVFANWLNADDNTTIDIDTYGFTANTSIKVSWKAQ